MNVFARNPKPPMISVAPTILLIVDCVPSENELAIWTPTSDSGAEPTSIHSASGTCTLPSWRWRTAPNDLKTAPCRMSVPTAVFGSKPKSRISIGVISEPPPIPVMPTSTPISRPARRTARSCARRQRAGDERPPAQQAAELVRLAAGAEAGGRREQRERRDEDAEAGAEQSAGRRRTRPTQP